MRKSLAPLVLFDTTINQVDKVGKLQLFFRNVKGLFSPLSLHFDRIRRNVKVKGRGEYDIVADDKKTAPLQDFVAGVPGQQDTGRSWRAGGEG